MSKKKLKDGKRLYLSSFKGALESQRLRIVNGNKVEVCLAEHSQAKVRGGVTVQGVWDDKVGVPRIDLNGSFRHLALRESVGERSVV